MEMDSRIYGNNEVGLVSHIHGNDEKSRQIFLLAETTRSEDRFPYLQKGRGGMDSVYAKIMGLILSNRFFSNFIII